MQAFEPMRLFLHLSRTLHFGRTSEQCHVSPSTLSRTIRQLEDELAVELFSRDRRHVELTPAGRRFQSYAGDALERWHSFEQELAREGPLSGSISIYCTITASQSILPPILRRFREEHPAVHIKLETGYAADALAMLSGDSVDVTIAALPDHLPRGVETRVLAVTPLVFVAPIIPSEVSRAVERRHIRWADIPMVLPEAGLARDYTERWFKDKGIKPNVYSEIPSHEAILSLVSLGCGVGVVPGLVLEKSPLREDVRVLDVKPSLKAFTVGACVRRRSLESPLITAFWNAAAAS